jgi:hypothetical protein
MINTVNVNTLNQATAKYVHHCAELRTYLTHTDPATWIQDCCDYDQDEHGLAVGGSLTCKQSFCQDTWIDAKHIRKCTTLSAISPPAGGQELSPGSGALPPSIAPGDSGTENNNEPEKNTGQNTGDNTTTSMKNESKDIKDRNDLSLEPLNPPNEESNKFEPEINAAD